MSELRPTDRELRCSEGDPECTMAACAYDEYYGGADKRCPNCPMTADKNVELAANITMLYFLDIEMACLAKVFRVA